MSASSSQHQTGQDQADLARAAAKKIKLLLLDVDGVLSDGRIFFSANGDELKAFSTLDGHGIKLLQKSGVHVGVITGRQSSLTERRCRDLGIKYLKQAREDKWAALAELRKDHSALAPISNSEIAFVGDDYPDLLVMTKIGLPCSVPNAVPPVKERALYITSRAGGEGAVREVCDFIMMEQNSFDEALARYTNGLTDQKRGNNP